MSGRAVRRHALRVLALFIAMIVVTGMAPWVEARAGDRPCTMDGDDAMDADEAHHAEGHSHTPEDHAAHCPLCMPAAAPPAPFSLNVDPDRPVVTLATRRYSARIAAVVGAPFPPRAPPVHS